jgi:U3 small nucleolar RNA-associated protein 10
LQAVGEYLDALAIVIERHSRSSLVKDIGIFSEIMMNLFDLRWQRAAKNPTTTQEAGQLNQLEARINEVVIQAVYKLNDAAFQPVLSQLLEWSASLDPRVNRLGRTYRLQNVFGFLKVFFGRLRSIVTSYASYTMESTIAILRDANLQQVEERELWKRVLEVLRECFLYDQDAFWQSPSHFNKIVEPLVAQFSKATTPGVSEVIIPAVVELAATVESQEHQKELNTAILKHLRSQVTAVRLAAVQCEQSLTSRIGEPWMGLLPEMLPYISELQDDDDEIVDRETQKWIIGIESVLGESLDAMLQ